MIVYSKASRALSAGSCLLWGVLGLEAQEMEFGPLESFDEKKTLSDWFSVNDGVMGGVSEGGLTRTKAGTLLFSGNLSLDNNGGFASIRNRMPGPFPADTLGIRVKVHGDGRTYGVSLRQRLQDGRSAYRAPMETSGQGFEEVFIPFSEFQLTRFGNRVPGPPLNPAEIQSVGFIIADKQEGPFRLEIASIERAYPASTEAGSLPNHSPRSLILLAVERGAPLFNDGNPGACRALYEMTCRALLGFEDLPGAARQDLHAALQRSEAVAPEADKAWILRYSLDRVLAMVSE